MWGGKLSGGLGVESSEGLAVFLLVQARQKQLVHRRLFLRQKQRRFLHVAVLEQLQQGPGGRGLGDETSVMSTVGVFVPIATQ
jgi:hypothetical protein